MTGSTAKTALTFLIAVSAWAQPERSYPLERITVQGNQHYTAAQIIAASGLKVGQAVSKADFDAARELLVASGVFDGIA